MKTTVRNTFITGIAVTLPLILTILAMKWLVLKINSWVLNPFTQFLRPYLESKYAIMVAKFGVLLTVVLLIFFIGLAAKIIVVRQFFGLWERIFVKIPVVGKIYGSLKQFSHALFSSGGKAIFKRVVLVEWPKKGSYAIGFVTGQTIQGAKNITSEGLVNVLVATTPNPASGFVLLLKKEDVIETDMTVEEGIKMVVTGGFVGGQGVDEQMSVENGTGPKPVS